MLDHFEPGGSMSWQGPTQSYLYRIFTNEQSELLLKRKGFPPTPLEMIEVGLRAKMGLISHGQGHKLCRNIICLEPDGFIQGTTLTAPDFAAGSLRPLYVLGSKERKVEGLGIRKVLSVVMGDEEVIGYEFDMNCGILVWTNNWQLEPGLPKTCQVELEHISLPLSPLDYQTKVLPYSHDNCEPEADTSQKLEANPSAEASMRDTPQTASISEAKEGELKPYRPPLQRISLVDNKEPVGPATRTSSRIKNPGVEAQGRSGDLFQGHKGDGDRLRSRAITWGQRR